jgi:transposase-like protein
MRKNYTPEFKATLVMELLREEITVNQLSSRHGIHPTQLNQWKKAVVEGIPELLTDKRKRDKVVKEQEELINDLYAQIGELTARHSWLKKKSGLII